MPAVGYGLEQDSPVADTATKAGKPSQLADIALKRILLHLAKRGQNSRAVLAGMPLRDFLAGPARTTVHSIEVLRERHIITARVGSHATAVGAGFDGGGGLQRNQPRRQVNP